MPERQESTIKPERARSGKNNVAQESGPKSHAIKTWEAGLVPGQESLKARTLSGEVGVARLKHGEIMQSKVNQIDAQEQAVLGQITPDNLIDSSELLHQTADSSSNESKDIDKVAEIFNENLDKLLRIIDLSGLKEPNIPLEGEHFLVNQEDAQAIGNELIKLGYNIEMIPGSTSSDELGFVAKKNNTQYNFIFSKSEEAQIEQPRQAA